MEVTRAQVLRHRMRVQGLDAAPDAHPAAGWSDRVAVLDLGVQDTGPDGAAWALALRGAPVTAGTPLEDLVLAWTLRGAPHAYRRREVADVARAVLPLSAADAAKRVADAARPLRAVGVDMADGLAEVAAAMRRVVDEPLVKGEMSTRLTAVMPEPYLRFCRPCQATHLYEQPFRLAALHAGLELEPGTSPPVLRPLPRWPARHTAGLADAIRTPPGERDVPAHLDVVRSAARLLGPTRPAEVAGFLEGAARDVKARWAELAAAEDWVEVVVEGEDAPRWLPPQDVAALEAAAEPSGAPVVRLLGPFDLLLQARDRELLVPDAARRADLWRVLGRPGAVLVDGEVVGTWRPRASGRRLAVLVEPWGPWDAATEAAVDEQVERLAAFRGLAAAGRA